MASPARPPQKPQPPPDLHPTPDPPAPPNTPGEAVAIVIKTISPPNSVREQAQKIEQKQRSTEKIEDQCYVRNSSFLSRDIEAKKVTAKVGKESPPQNGSPRKVVSPPNKAPSPPKKESSPPKSAFPAKYHSPPKTASPPKEVISPPPVSTFKIRRTDSKADENSVAAKASKLEAACSPPKKEVVCSPPKKEVICSPPKREVICSPPKREVICSPPKKEVTSPPVASFKINRSDSRENSGPPKVPKRENSLNKDIPRTEKLPTESEPATKKNNTDAVNDDKGPKNEETNGVGDKIKKFEKVAEVASGTMGRVSRPGSVRRARSDSKEDFPPPATPFKDNVHFELTPETNNTERHGIMKNSTQKWQRSESHEEKIQKPEPQKIIKPEFKPMPSPVDVTIRSPSLGAKIPDQFPSHGTAFRNVASPDPARNAKFNEDNTQKPCKFKPKEKYSVSKGSSYFTRGSEEIWLVKKKDIEEIEERVLDSFRRAGGNICMRSESMRPASDSGQGVSFSHATMGRNKRQMYARSESLDPQWAGARAQTLKRQTSVACTCGHDKKPVRAKSAGSDVPPRPRSRSHGDDNQHVLDKYETLV